MRMMYEFDIIEQGDANVAFKNMEYNFFKSLFKTVIRLGLVAIPLIVAILPLEWQNLTLGGALMLLLDYLKSKKSLA